MLSTEDSTSITNIQKTKQHCINERFAILLLQSAEIRHQVQENPPVIIDNDFYHLLQANSGQTFYFSNGDFKFHTAAMQLKKKLQGAAIIEN